MAGVGIWFRELFGTKELPPSGEDAQPRTHDEDNNEFALAMYRQLRQRPGNLFASPFSVRIALAMTLAGARGETAAQMREALCISSSDETLHVAISRIIQQLNAAGGGKYEMAVANSLWGQHDQPLLAGFLDLIARHYGGGMNLVDFRGDAETARRTINQWVDDKTKQKIGEVIPSGGVDDGTRLVLVNAIYFQGKWERPFRKTATRDEPFHLDGGETVQASLMHQREDVRYLQGGGYQAVDLSYRGGDLSMLVLLPDRQDGLRDLETRLTERMLHDCAAQMETREVKVFLPRFKITWGTADLRNQLTALGMALAFSSSEANFSGMNGLEPPHEDSLWISKVFHKTFVEVNEEGTEAAAATAVTMMIMGSRITPPPPPIPIFRADHPFLFAIRDRRSGAILFLGRMSDPTRDN
jgi:serpin B